MPEWIRRLDREDIAQERELARIEGRCPREAVRAYYRQEARFYAKLTSWERLYCPERFISDVQLHVKHIKCPCDSKPRKRTAEGIARRRERSREWWRANGAAYRAKRKCMNGSSVNGIPADSAAVEAR